MWPELPWQARARACPATTPLLYEDFRDPLKDAAHDADVTGAVLSMPNRMFTSSTLSMCATTESPDTITVRSSMLMISPIFLTGRRVSFASAVPEQKKFMTPSGSAARRECPGSSRRLNRAVATIRSMHRPSQQYSSTKRGPGAGFCNALQQFSARLPSRERQLGDVGGDTPGLVLVSRSLAFVISNRSERRRFSPTAAWRCWPRCALPRRG